MVGELVQMRCQVPRVDLLDRFTDAAMQTDLTVGIQRLIERGTDQRMREAKTVILEND